MSIYKMNAEIMKKKLENSIGIDDRFETSCKNCNGYCKKSNVTIILNPYDIYRVSKELNVKVPDFLNNYCTISPGYQTKLPVVQLNVINRLDEDMVEIRFVDLDNNKVEIIGRISKI